MQNSLKTATTATSRSLQGSPIVLPVRHIFLEAMSK
jgi:hypothetical protein